MKEFTRAQLESNRPTIEAADGIDFVLSALYAETRKRVTDEVVSNLTFEELIGVLLVARDEIQQVRKKTN